MSRILGLKISKKMEMKNDETYHVRACGELLLSFIPTRGFGEKSVVFIVLRKGDEDYIPQIFVYVLWTITTRHMVSFIDFYFANFQT